MFTEGTEATETTGTAPAAPHPVLRLVDALGRSAAFYEAVDWPVAIRLLTAPPLGGRADVCPAGPQRASE